MKSHPIVSFLFIFLIVVSSNGQLLVKKGTDQLMIITRDGKVGIGTASGQAPLGKLEIKTDDLHRAYLNGGTLYLSGGLRDQSYANNPNHYVNVAGGGWVAGASMYSSAFSTPGAVAHIFNRYFISGPGTSNNTSWQINSGVFLPKYVIVMVTDNAINFHQPHVAAADNQTGPLRLGVNLTNGNLTISGEAYKPGGGSWQASSDQRLKDVRGNFTPGLDVLQLNAVKYNYKKDNPRNHESDIEYIGFIAQDVEKILPEAVSVGSDGYLNLDMHVVNVALLNAVKEQQALIESLQAENARLSSSIAALAELKAEVEAIKKSLEAPPDPDKALSQTDM
jgi:hypothetical protein